MIPTTLGVALVVFLLYQAAPGDPATVMIGMSSGAMAGNTDYEARIAAFRTQHGLDRALPVQFLNYIGPFNLLRDGHSWFSSPYGEREVREVELPGGRTLVEGVPLPIGTSSDVSTDLADRWREWADTLRAHTGDTAPVVADELVSAGPAAVPALLTALASSMDDPDRYARGVEHLSSTLARISGHRPEIPLEYATSNGPAALIKHWFGWYYTDGAGRRVKNSGERPWGGLLALDLGEEMQRKTPVAGELLNRLKVTVPLSLVSVLLSYLIAIPLGIFSVRRQGTRIDAVMTVILFVLYSIPTFWAGLMLILAFGIAGPDWWWWPQLPVIGLHDKDAATMGTLDYIWDTILHVVLPVVTLTYGTFAYLSRQMRAGMLDVIRQDYIRTARAKGLSERVVVYKHALRNSLIPVITLFASVLPILIGGSIIVEAVFDIQGMGKYAFEGLLRRDFYIVMATTVFVGIMTQLGILVSDITYSLVDPRIRYD